MQKATLIKKEEVSHSIFTFWLEPQKGLGYEAGQAIVVSLPHDNTDERGDTRWFSLSSSPTEPYPAITTKLPSDSTSSFKEKLRHLQVGDELTISLQPMGDFLLPRDNTIPLVFIAGGVGSAPMRALIKHILDTEDERDIEMFYTAKQHNNFPFLDLFKQQCSTVHIFPTGTEDAKRLTGNAIIQSLDKSKLESALFYISGPEYFVDTVQADLRANSIPQSRLILSHFHNYEAL